MKLVKHSNNNAVSNERSANVAVRKKKRQQQLEAKTQQTENKLELVEEEAEERQPVIPRRQRRQLEQKVRITDEVKKAASITTLPMVMPDIVSTTVEKEEKKISGPTIIDTHVEAANQPEIQQDTVTQSVASQSAVSQNNEQQDNTMPRRSRRSPRHLRVSGQRRRRYRDERNLTQSPVPLTMAVVSPELSSGKVWVRYPVTPVTTTEPEIPAVVDTVEETVPAQQEDIIVIPAMAESAATPSIKMPVVSESKELKSEINHDEKHQPEILSDGLSDKVLHDAIPHDSEETRHSAEPIIVTSIVEQEHHEEQPTVATEICTEAEEVETEEAKVTESSIIVEKNHHAYSPMTKAPAPDIVTKPVIINEWQRPACPFKGKGGAGGHSATSVATSAMFKPQLFE